jgi:hypothetical protein
LQETLPKRKREPGALKALTHIPDSFYEPMSEEELPLWEGGNPDDPLNQKSEMP